MYETYYPGPYPSATCDTGAADCPARKYNRDSPLGWLPWMCTRDDDGHTVHEAGISDGVAARWTDDDSG